MNDADFYHSRVDFDKLTALGIRYVMYRPWQIGLYHDDLIGKLVWYPKAGTLMYQDDKEDALMHGYKIGETGDWIAGGYDADETRPTIHEEILEEIKNIIYKQKFGK